MSERAETLADYVAALESALAESRRREAALVAVLEQALMEVDQYHYDGALPFEDAARDLLAARDDA